MIPAVAPVLVESPTARSYCGRSGIGGSSVAGSDQGGARESLLLVLDQHPGRSVQAGEEPAVRVMDGPPDRDLLLR